MSRSLNRDVPLIGYVPVPEQERPAYSIFKNA